MPETSEYEVLAFKLDVLLKLAEISNQVDTISNSALEAALTEVVLSVVAKYFQTDTL